MKKCTVLLSMLLAMALPTVPCSGYHEIAGQRSPGCYLQKTIQLHNSTDLGMCSLTGVPNTRKFIRLPGRSCRLAYRSGKRDEKNGTEACREIPFEAFVYGFSPETITVRRGDRVVLLITSRDEPHCIVIGEYGVKVPVQKGVTEKTVFTADQPGEFVIECSLACRNRHAGSKARLVVEE